VERHCAGWPESDALAAPPDLDARQARARALGAPA
jgi:hypothetical protein